MRIVLQDALSEVTKIYPSLKLRVFGDDFTALVKGKKEVAAMAKRVMQKLKEEAEKKGLKLSVTENVKEGKSKDDRVLWIPGGMSEVNSVKKKE